MPTPVTYFAAHHLGTGSCVSVTGSHNPPDYNGLKMVLGGETLYGALIQSLRQMIESAPLRRGPAAWCAMPTSREAYLDRIVEDVKLSRPMKIVVDCGNGVAGDIAPELFRRMGCEVVELFCKVDGTFPNHHPDPVQAREPRGRAAAPCARPTPNWAWPSTATATASASSPRTARSSIPTAS